MTDASRPDPREASAHPDTRGPRLMPDQPDFTIEAYGTVTPPPEPEPDANDDDGDETEDDD